MTKTYLSDDEVWAGMVVPIEDGILTPELLEQAAAKVTSAEPMYVLSVDKEERSVRIGPKKKYPWDNYEFEDKTPKPKADDEKTEMRRMIRAERKRLKKLRHAGVPKEQW